MDVTIVTLGRPEITANVTRGAARLLVDLGYAPLTEVTLPNGRRADLMALSAKGELVIFEVKSGIEDYRVDRKWLVIFEVKSGIEDYRVDRKWHEYLPYCDRFAFAVAPEFPREILPEEPGLIVCDSFGGAVLREAPVSPLAPARRKALTIAFARLAAMRAAGVAANTLEA